MAATFGASTGATFASIVFLFELTRDYDAILPLMIAAVAADLVARALLRDTLMTEKLTRRGLRVPSDYHADALRTTTVAEVMTPDVETVPAGASVAEVARRFREGGHGAYPVVDGAGAVVGIIARGDLLRQPDDAATLESVASRDVVSAAPSDTVLAALEVMLDESVDHIPVLADGRLVGICTRGDVLSARKAQFADERPQPGWRPRTRPGANSGRPS
jgi:CBS domain-containing protein